MGHSTSKELEDVDETECVLKQSSKQPIQDIICNPSYNPIEFVISAYCRLFYQNITNKIIPTSLQLLITDYTTLGESPQQIDPVHLSKHIFYNLDVLLKTNMSNNGRIIYNKNKNHLKIHCYGNAYIDDHLPLNGSIQTIKQCIDHLELIVNGVLVINDNIVMQNGGFLDIKCRNLDMKPNSFIASFGNTFGGKINLNIEYNMKCWGDCRIFANAYNTEPHLNRNGGEININIGNHFESYRIIVIDVGGRTTAKFKGTVAKYWCDHELPCSNGIINIDCKSMDVVRAQHVQWNNGDHTIVTTKNTTIYAGDGGTITINGKNQ